MMGQQAYLWVQQCDESALEQLIAIEPVTCSINSAASRIRKSGHATQAVGLAAYMIIAGSVLAV